MGFFSRFIQVQKLTIEDIQLPDRVESDLGILTFPVTDVGFLKLDIVGESRHQDFIKQIAEVSQEQKFPIYLVPEPGNQFDKNAVKVHVGMQMVGYVAKGQAKILSKILMEKIESEKALVFGLGKTNSRDGKIFGVFGHVYVGVSFSSDPNKISPCELNDSQISSIKLKLSKIIETEMPETLAKLKSSAKKADPLVAQLLGHALWQFENPDAQPPANLSKAEDLIGECHSVLENFAELVWAVDPEVVDEYDLVSDLETLLDVLNNTGEIKS